MTATKLTGKRPIGPDAPMAGVGLVECSHACGDADLKEPVYPKENMQRKRFSRAAHAKLVFDLSAEFGKDAAWKLAAMDALRKADPYDLLLMHGLTTAEQLEFVEALIQKHLSRSGFKGFMGAQARICKWRSVVFEKLVIGRLCLDAFLGIRASSSSFWSCGLIHHVPPAITMSCSLGGWPERGERVRNW